MHYQTKLLKNFAAAAISVCCMLTAAFAQNVIDTASRPTVFALGVVSTPFEEVAATFKPDGNTVYFAQGTIVMQVCFSKKVGGKWAKPNVASFSGHWGDWDPFLSPDAKRIYFVSNRPLDTTAANKLKRNTHLWYADNLGGDNWSEPKYINAPFNLDSIGNFAPSVSKAGNLFFYSPQRDKSGKGRSYYAKWLGDHFDEPKMLGLNGDKEVGDPCVAPDESYIVFVSGNDLFISFRNGDTWEKGQNLGPQVNSGESNYDPTVSPDGKTVYYTSNKIRGLYKRDPKKLPLNYDGLLEEMNSIFNGKGNILMIPIKLPPASH
jgi:Tol biopolymer transport system component